MYHQRLARPEDAIAIAPLWRDFAQRRSEADPSINLKPDFDYEGYVGYQLKKPLSFGFVLEYEQQTAILILKTKEDKVLYVNKRTSV